MNNSEVARIAIRPDSGRWIRYTNNITEKFSKNRGQILLCLIATFTWGLVAHAYVFFHSSFSHDSLNEFNAEVYGNNLKIQAGRVFVPFYRFLVRSDLTLPWLIGLLSLLYISIAVFLTVKLFKITSKVQTALIAGIFTVNITVIATAATYIHDLDSNMLGMMLSVVAVYLWQRYDNGFLIGMIFVCLSLGFYQSFVSVTITLILFYLILRLLDGKTFLDTLKRGIKSIGMLIGGGILYLVSVKVICSVTGIALSSGHYNSLDTPLSMSPAELIHAAIEGYIYTCTEIPSVLSPYSEEFVLATHIVMAVAVGLIILCGVFQKKVHIMEKILAVILTALIPLGMNVVYVLLNGEIHDVMLYAFWQFYLLVLLLAWWAVAHFAALKPVIKRVQLVILSALIFITLWGNVQTANEAYLKKDLEYEANLSLFTRIVYQMEHSEGYVTGETPVVFVGTPSSLLSKIPGFEDLYSGMTGEKYIYVLGSTRGSTQVDRYKAYFHYVLMNPALIADYATWIEIQASNEVADMPCYPAEGSVAIVDDVLVVKLSE